MFHAHEVHGSELMLLSESVPESVSVSTGVDLNPEIRWPTVISNADTDRDADSDPDIELPLTRLLGCE